MIPEPGDINREVPVNETFHVQTDDELTEKELKQIAADDQAIQTILLGLPKDIYAAVDSCETTQEIWLRVQQMMKGSDIGIQEKKAKQYAGQNVGNLNGYNAVQNVGNQVAQNPRVQNVGNQNGPIGVPGNANQNENGNLVAARAEENATGHNGNQIRCYNCRGVGHFTRNCTVKPRRRDAAYLQTQLLIALKEEAGIQLQAEEFDLMASAADLDEIEMTLETHNWSSSAHQELHKIVKDEIFPIVNQVDARDKAYNDMQQKIERLEAQLGDLKGKSKDTSCVSDTINPLSQKLENENVELEFQVSVQKDNNRGTSMNTKFAKQSILGKPPKLGETQALSKPVTSNSIPTPQESKVVKNDKVIAPGMFRINPFKTFRVEKHVPNTVRASVMTKPITVSQPRVITKKVVNSDSNGLSSTGFLGTVRFRNDHGAAILGFGDLQWGNILITRVYFVERLGRNLFLVGQFCDSDLEVAFRRNTCFVRNLEGVDLLKGNRTTNLYTINLQDMASTSPICLMARASSTKSWLWHQRKSKRASHPPKPVPNSRQRLHLLHMDLCGPMRIASINGKRYVLVIVDDYSRYTWFHFLRSKDEAPENDREDTGKLGAKGDIGFFIGYSVDSCELDLLFEAMYDDFIGGQQSAAQRTIPAAQAHPVRQTTTISTSIADTPPTPTNSSSQATNFSNTSQDVDELRTQQQHAQQQGNQVHLQSETAAENVSNAMFDDNTFVNPFANPSTSAAESSSSQNVDPSNMHTFYQPYPP
nr:integrase, catalytic region, zinc finger, CCHC-type, peptidase aspartic, catalytic [Tanacetum cinerariifolium]GEZ06412.1 integrase, catalytic region, zinc finger, CCHC-type, peptidase aspartic, catalytic [Tanacetum cinerariifolium]